MSKDLRQSYIESDILHAGGAKLVVLLYRAAIEAVSQARSSLARGEIKERSRQITRASEILNELALALDHRLGSEISRNLGELYVYLQDLLRQANSLQIEPPLAEVERILLTLLEAWESCDAAEPPAAPAGLDPALAFNSQDRAPVDCLG